jgi:hypothetical protein
LGKTGDEKLNEASVIKLILIIGLAAFLAWKWLPAFLDITTQSWHRIRDGSARNHGKRPKLVFGRSGIFRLAALALVVMVIYMPTYVYVGELKTDFDYRFIWTLGATVNRWGSVEPAISMLLTQVAVVVAIAGLLAAATKN